MNDKLVRPPYTSYRSFESLIKELKEHDILPAAIDRGLLAKRSGSEQSALFATLKWFKLIDESHAPTELLSSFISAGEDDARQQMKEMIENSYSFVTDGTINLKNATSNQMASKFREYDVSGSTLTKSIAFFIAAAKSAGITLSPHIKAPPAPSTTGKKKPTKQTPTEPTASQDKSSASPAPDTGTISIPIPIMGLQDGAISLPANMNARQWNSVIKMTEFILQNYRATMADDDDYSEEV
ncbi:hypothetical protein ACRSLK_07875 [Halopseudomonas pachastrellae]|uniref:hypothetical protein n=1 Tax=Halopseudomonas pachastrellae TaxID=254161 RepID=UPI003D7DE1EC